MKFPISIFVSLLLAHPAQAFRLSPMVVEFAPSGKNATQTVLLENTEKTRVALQLEVMKRKVDIDGKEDRSEPASDFVLYPDQLTLEPGQRRNVRLTWTGNAAPSAEQAFRLVASQLPVTLARPTNRVDVKVNLKFILQYVASLYVIPDGAKPDIRVESAKIKKAGRAEIVLKNSGGAHRVLEKSNIKVHSKEKEFAVPEAEMKELRSQNILGGSSRRIEVSVPKDFHDISAEIHFD